MRKTDLKLLCFSVCFAVLFGEAVNAGVVQKKSVKVVSVKGKESGGAIVLSDTLCGLSGKTVYDKEFIELSIKSIFDVSALTAGYAQGTFRGSRPGAGGVKYYLNGITLANPSGGISGNGYNSGAGIFDFASEIPVLSVKKMEILSGDMPAEFGNAGSAIVNMTTKKGYGSEFHGTIRFESDAAFVLGEKGFYAPPPALRYKGPDNLNYDPVNNPPGPKEAGKGIHHANLFEYYRKFPVSRIAEYSLTGPVPYGEKYFERMTFNLGGYYTHNGPENTRKGGDYGYSLNGG